MMTENYNDGEDEKEDEEEEDIEDINDLDIELNHPNRADTNDNDIKQLMRQMQSKQKKEQVQLGVKVDIPELDARYDFDLSHILLYRYLKKNNPEKAGSVIAKENEILREHIVNILLEINDFVEYLARFSRVEIPSDWFYDIPFTQAVFSYWRHYQLLFNNINKDNINLEIFNFLSSYYEQLQQMIPRSITLNKAPVAFEDAETSRQKAEVWQKHKNTLEEFVNSDDLDMVYHLMTWQQYYQLHKDETKKSTKTVDTAINDLN